jgi:hypothetical protein
VIIADGDGICVVARKDAPAARQAANESIANKDAKVVKLVSRTFRSISIIWIQSWQKQSFTMSRRVIILKNLTTLIAVTAIRAALFQNRLSKNQPRGDYLQKIEAAYAVALFYGSLLAETRRQIAI